MNSTVKSSDARAGGGHRIGSLDGLRSIAILLVLAGHCCDNYFRSDGIPNWVEEIIGNSSFGVRLFFVLSGFLITSLLIKERQATGRVSLARFYLRRTLRIFPAFYLYVGTILLLTVFGVLKISGSQFLAAMTYTWNYNGLWIHHGTVEGSWFLGHLWTLALEEQFYLCWPLLFILIPFFSLRWIPVVAALTLPMVRIVTYYAVPEWRGYLGMMFHTAIDSILIGCGFAIWTGSLSTPKVLRSLKSLLPLILLIPLVVSPLLRARFGGAYSVTLGMTMDALCVGSLLILLINQSAGKGLTTLLTASPLQWLGRLSYSLYLWQQLFLTNLNYTWTGYFPISLVAALVAACLSYYLVETPLMRFKNRFVDVRITQS